MCVAVGVVGECGVDVNVVCVWCSVEVVYVREC